jgi:UDP-2,3-diacylglucosamine pyrophosphatase LpxH
MTSDPNRKYRAIFLSDFHLGSAYCQAARLRSFLAHHDAEQIYLVGDIVEANSHHQWPASHRGVVGELATKLLNGTKIVYTPGNHDRIFLNYIGAYANLTIVKDVEHYALNGEGLLVTHGDVVDRFQSWTLLHVLLSFEKLLARNLWELMRRRLGSLISRHELQFEEKMMAYASQRGYSRVICGHIHKPKIVGTSYMNCGDWLHHCTAIVENFDGTFEMVQG